MTLSEWTHELGRVAVVRGGNFRVDMAQVHVLQAGGCISYQFAREL